MKTHDSVADDVPEKSLEMSGRATLTIVTSIETRNIEIEVIHNVAQARRDSNGGLVEATSEAVTAVTDGTVRLLVLAWHTQTRRGQGHLSRRNQVHHKKVL